MGASTNPVTSRQLEILDEFLEQHPNIRSDANKNPDVLKDTLSRGDTRDRVEQEA